MPTPASVHRLEQIERADRVVAESTCPGWPSTRRRARWRRSGPRPRSRAARIRPRGVPDRRGCRARAVPTSPPSRAPGSCRRRSPAGGPRQREALRCGCRCIPRRRSQESSSLLLRLGSSPPPAARHLGASSGRVETNRPDVRRARRAAFEHVGVAASLFPVLPRNVPDAVTRARITEHGHRSAAAATGDLRAVDAARDTRLARQRDEPVGARPTRARRPSSWRAIRTSTLRAASRRDRDRSCRAHSVTRSCS